MIDCYFCGKELPQGKTYCASCDMTGLIDAKRGIIGTDRGLMPAQA